MPNIEIKPKTKLSSFDKKRQGFFILFLKALILPRFALFIHGATVSQSSFLLKIKTFCMTINASFVQ